jgi:hypothetical protein
MMTDSIHLFKTTVTGAKLRLGNRRYHDALGPDAVLRGCEVTFHGGGVTITRTRFEACAIKGAARLRSMRFDQARFVRCGLEGRFYSAVFGNYGGLSDDWEDAGVFDCDLSRAWLHLARFHRCRFCDNRWPPWPQICVSVRAEHVEDWLTLALPAAFRTDQEIIAMDPRHYGPDTVGVLDLSAEGRLDATEDLRRVLAAKPYIHIEPDATARA